ncbi:MAG TPA: Gldg family protein [Spirochaetota bacterium]|nr:Gldg family protein [Spirochaetota bacterium]HOM38320.1 Gldg family protein [Spirochaetota bacterium]HPQ48462.1 Gldg family protein [Spirochaetota bacterium]
MKKNINWIIGVLLFLAFTSYFLDWAGVIYIIFTLFFLGFSGLKVYYILKTENKKNKNRFFSYLNLFLVLFIIIALYLIFLKYPIKLDLTTDKTYSLTDKTKEIINKIDFPVKIIVFQTDSTPDIALGEEGYRIYNNVKNLLEEYKRRNNKIEIEFIDPNEEPMRAKNYNLRNIGDIIIESQRGNRYIEKGSMVKWGFEKDMFGGYRRVIEAYKTEEKITSSLLSLIEEGKISIGWIIGDEEVSITSDNGASILKEALENNNFEVKEIKSTEKLGDYDLYIIAGAKKVLTQEIINSLKEKLKNKKTLIVLQDPLIDIEETGVNKIIKEYGFGFKNWIMIDEKNSFRTPINILPEYVSSKITSALEAKKIPVVMSLVSFIDDIEVKDIEKERVLLCSKESCEVVKNIKKVAQSGIEKKDREKITKEAIIAAIGKNKSNDSKVVVIADSDFITNNMINMGANKDFFLNLLNYVLEKKSPLSIEKPVEKERRMMISEGSKKYYLYFYVILLPLLVVGTGIYIGLKRRKLKTL